jgi:hypothetical protein
METNRRVPAVRSRREYIIAPPYVTPKGAAFR